MSWLPGVCLQCYACDHCTSDDVLPRQVATSLRTRRLTPKHLEIDPWTSEGVEGVAEVADVAVDSVDFQTLKRCLGYHSSHILSVDLFSMIAFWVASLLLTKL